jgi:DNA-binding SARP family transcriptional activator
MLHSEHPERKETNNSSKAYEQLPNAINLLKLMQRDYQGARQQIEQISLQLAEREALINQHLQYTYSSSQNYPTFCLTASGIGSSTSLMGNVVLGEVSIPAVIPFSINAEIRCLGRFEIFSSQCHVRQWSSVKARSVLQYLLIKPREPTLKETLMEALWPDCSPQAAGNNLKAAIYNLRLTLNELLPDKNETQFILFRQGRYLINPEINLKIDVEAFEKHWLEGRNFEKKRQTTEAIREFEKAESLYNGDYLEDEPYEEWALLRREGLKDIYLIILSKLADHSLKEADYESCICYSQKILAKDPFREDTYRRLMYCYSRSGQKNRAIRWYELCQKTFKRELDAAPDNETTKLNSKILKDEIL